MTDKKVYVGKKGTKTSYAARHWSKTPRRPLNRFEAESNSKRVSAPAKKLKVCDKDFDVNYAFSYRIINFLAVFSAISLTREVIRVILT